MEAKVARMDDEQAHAWLALVAVSQLLPAALDQQLLADSGLTHFEYMTLGILYSAPDRTLRASALASATNSALPRLSKVAGRLEARGLVERSQCPSDGRATNVRLTSAGRAAWVRATPKHLDLARERVLGALDATQLAPLADALCAIVRSLDPDAALLANDSSATPVDAVQDDPDG